MKNKEVKINKVGEISTILTRKDRKVENDGRSKIVFGQSVGGKQAIVTLRYWFEISCIDMVKSCKICWLYVEDFSWM